MVQNKVYYRTSGDVLWYRIKCTIERLETFYGTDVNKVYYRTSGDVLW